MNRMSGAIRVIDHLWNEHTSVIVATRDDILFIPYIGPSLCTADEFDDFRIDPMFFARGIVGGGLDIEVTPALIALPSQGWTGAPGLEVSRDGRALPLDLRVTETSWDKGIDELFCVLADATHGVCAEVLLSVKESNVFTIDATVKNLTDGTLEVSATHFNVPVGGHAAEVMTLGGRHAMEAVQQRTPWGRSRIAIENRTGRTSHEQLGVIFAGTAGFTEQTGEVWGIHLAWSGNFRIMCDGVTETRKTIQIGELLQPHEVHLAPYESFTFPRVVVSYSPSGLSGCSQNFHEYVRSMQPRIKRPVVLNTWEAVYFNHDLATLKSLATAAADVGIERFVLDDGWFNGRRNDTAGLGDWTIDTSVWPDGLSPIVSHVRSLGMDFGLWFEPEMVNPDSDLYRAHPEWALDGSLTRPILGRNQLVLDLSRSDVREYLFHSIDALLSSYEIAYVKWDHNRPLIGGASHQQTLGFYALLDQLTQQHPTVQFESCASGGGRIDAGVAQRVNRFWASDSIDALDRLEIQKGLSTFMPIEMLGSHIGSPTCHTTGRKHALSFRATTALFGWLGVEWNLLTLTDKEKDGLRSAIEFYKEQRDFLHSESFVRVDHPDSSIDIRGVYSPDAEGLFAVTRLHSGPSNHSAPLQFPMFRDAGELTVEVIHLGTPRWALHRSLPQWVTQSPSTMSGAMLANVGLPMPSLLPESSFLIRFSPVVHS
jgi:alpha-galactosidase